MLLPTNISTGRVTGQFLAGVVDGADLDQDPDAIPAAGLVTFTASVPYLPDPTAAPNPATILTTSIVAVLDFEGYLCTPVEGTLEPAYRGVRLIATDDPDLSVEGWTWNATYSFRTVAGQVLTIPTHSFAVPSGAEVDLTTVIKVPSSTGIGTEQAEALAASAQAAAVAASQDAAAAAEAAAEAAGAAQVTDAGISTLMTTEGTATQEAVADLVDASNAAKLDVDDAVNTYQSQASLDAAAAAKVGSSGSALNGAVKTLADEAAENNTTKLDASQKGAASGVATLDSASKVPVAQIPDDVKAGNGAKPVGRGELVINVCDYGAKGDHVSGTGNGTDNLAAFNAAYAAAKAASTFGAACIYIPRGKYRFSGEWDIYRPNSPRFDLVIKGESNLTTFLIADFFGAGKSLVKAHDPAGVTRCSPTTIMHIQFGTVTRTGGTNPVLLDIYGHGESRLESIRFGPCNNTVMSIGGLQNVRYRDIVSFYGGKHFSYRDTTGITFTTTNGSTTLTASADIFNGADEGRILNLYGATAAKYLIATYVDARTVLISATTPAISATGVSGVFEPARITTTAGSNQVSANASVFTADDIGRVIYIMGAKSGPWGEALLRAKITGLVSALTVTIDVNADIAKTRTEFALPTIDLYSPDRVDQLGTILGGSNDFKIDLLHVENYSGMGLVVQNAVFGHITDMKFHGEHSPTNTSSSAGQMWLDDYSGVISGELDGQATGDHRVYLCNMNDMLTFDWLSTRRAVNARIFEVGNMTDPGGIAEVKSFNSYTATATGDPYELVQDANTSPRVVFTGLVNMLGDTAGPRIYSGKDSYFLTTGQFVRGPSVSSGFDQILSGQTGSRTMYEDYATKKFSIGNVAGGGTAFTLTDESAALVRLLVNTTGSVLPGANNTQPLGSSTSRWSEVYGTTFRPGGGTRSWSSGTGTPEGVVTAAVGSMFTREDGGVGTTLYVKETGAGNTGWTAK